MAKKTRLVQQHPFEPDYAVPPGQTLLETITELGMDQKEFAQRSGFTEKHINQVIKGKAPISPDAAIRFERVTGVPATFWNNLEAQHQDQLARLAAKEQLQAGLDWLKRIPVRELVRRNAVADSRDSLELLASVLQFFGVASVAAWNSGWSKPEFAFRKSTAVTEHIEALASWLRLGELAALEMECRAYSAKKFRNSLTEIRALTLHDPEDFVPRMVQLCADAGVALALVPEMKGAPVSGAAKWISARKAMICLNLRGKFNDRFWFTFFHEAGHILNDSKHEVFVDVDYKDNPREHLANEFAASILIPTRYESQLQSLKSEWSVRRFAEQLGIHPGIVVGRLQRDEILPYSHLNGLKVRFQWAEDADR